MSLVGASRADEDVDEVERGTSRQRAKPPGKSDKTITRKIPTDARSSQARKAGFRIRAARVVKWEEGRKEQERRIRVSTRWQKVCG